MAMLAAKADGLLTSASTWALVDPTSQADPLGSTSGLTTSYQASATFTPGAISIDGIALYLATRGASGTITVALDQAGADVAGTVVTINATDLPLPPAGLNGWVFFKFAAPVTLLAATAYSVKAKASVASAATLYKFNATAGNWARYLRTTTQQAPAAGDMLCVTGEYTGAGTSNLRTVTMDDAAAGATVYGQVDVCSKGTLQYGTTAGVNYYLKLAGNLNVNAGGTLNMGTASTPMPTTSNAILFFNCATNVQYGLEVKDGGTWNACGATCTVRAYLAADAPAGSTTLVTDVNTGWKSGQSIVVASTSRTGSETELKVLSSDAAGTSVPVPALAAAHSGTSPTRAEVILLNRNVRINGASPTQQTYVNIAATAVVDVRYVQFFWLGSGTGNKRGIDLVTTTGSVSILFCAIHDNVAASSMGINAGGSGTQTIDNLVTYNINHNHILMGSAVTNLTSVTNCVLMLGVATAAVFAHASLLGAGTVNNVTVVGGATTQIVISFAAAVTGTIGNLTAHSGAGVGAQILNLVGGTLGSITSWRNNGHGVQCEGLKNVTVDAPTAFGNNGSGLIFVNAISVNVTVKSPNFYCGSILQQGFGLNFFASCYGIQVDSPVLGSPSTHTTADVFVQTGMCVTANFHNALMTSPTEVSNANALATGSRVSSQRHDQTAGNHKSWLREGTIQVDTTIADASPSQRLTPALSAEKLKSGRLRVAVLNSQTVTFTVKVRKSAAGDGTAYNGNQPRLMLEKNVAAGVAADQVLATAAAAAGQWETLQGTTPAAQGNTVFTFYVDCDGTTGWVNVDTAGAS